MVRELYLNFVKEKKKAVRHCRTDTRRKFQTTLNFVHSSVQEVSLWEPCGL